MPKCRACGAVLNAHAHRCAVCDAPIAVAAPVGVQISQGGLVALPADELPIAAELGKALAPSIVLRKRIGRGGMGIVFLGRDESLKRDVAIKVLTPDLANDSVTRARFVREAEAAAAVSHPNVVKIYHVGVLQLTGVPYFVMEYVDGPSMAEAAGRMLAEARVRRVIGEVASGLAVAHRRGVVHRDIKPGNIVIDGETGRALLCDFGIAAAGKLHAARRSDRLTSEGSYVGTPAYMSPEIASGEEAIDKSDVYSLGVVAYELLTGRPPFTGPAIKVMAAHVHDEVPDLHALRADLSPELVELVERSLAKNPVDRPSAQSIVDHLLPGNRHALEWPPPGLAPLRRASAQLRFGLLSLALMCSAFLFAVSARPVPQLGHAGARATETFDLARSMRAVMPQVVDTDDDLQEVEIVWGAVSYTTFLLLMLATSFVAVQTIPTVRAMRMARRSGYPWATVADVMSDMRRDGGDLLSGLGSYAFFSDRERSRILRVRRFRLVAIGLAATVAVLALLLWVAGLVAAIAGDPTGVSMAPVWLSLVPLSVVGVCAGLAAYEALFRRRRAQADEQWQGAHLVSKELVSAWVVSAGRRFHGSTGLSRFPLEIAFGAVLLVLVSAVLIIANAALGVAIRASAHRSAAVSWVATVSDSGYARAWRNRDQTIARAVSSLTTNALPPDERSQARFLASFVPHTSASQALLPREAADSALFVDSLRRVAPGDLANALSRLPAAPVAPSFFAGESPVAAQALAGWRAMAHSAPLPLFWPFRAGVEAPEPVAVDHGALHTLAAANLRHAIRALVAGDLPMAERRARENLAVARQLTRAGSAPFMVVGAIASDAADVLAYVGRARNDRNLITEAGNLRSAGVFRPTPTSAGALFADPTYLPVTRLVADTLLEPATRVQLAQLAAAGFCENPREVLFGPTSSREILARQAAEGVRDLEGADRLVGPWAHWLSLSIASGRTPLAAAPGAIRAPTEATRAVRFATGLFRLHGLRSRLAYCSQS